VDVPIVPGCFIVNIGDLMARWTNDAWVSTPATRVANPPPDAGAESRRQSLVFFHNPNYDAKVSCIPTCLESGETPKYPPTTSGEHLRRLFLGNADKRPATQPPSAKTTRTGGVGRLGTIIAHSQTTRHGLRQRAGEKRHGKIRRAFKIVWPWSADRS